MKRLLYILLLVLVAAGCELEEPATFVESKMAEVNIGLHTEGSIELVVSDDITVTKAIADPQNIEKTADVIKNLWIIQYNGTDNSATLLGEPTYISNFAEFDGKAKLVSTSSATAIYFIANTFEDTKKFPIAQGSTIADLKARTKELENQYAIFGKDSETYHPIFYTRVDKQVITEGMDINATLVRNIAKVEISITNNTPAEERVTIKSAQICSVPQISYYVPGTENALFPASHTFKTIDYEPLEWPEANNTLAFTAYLPANKRGTNGSASPAYKNIGHPDDATFLKIQGTYLENDIETPITYTFYLGDNLTNDFNILPNRRYRYNIEINSVGNSKTDSRIEDWGTVDFTSTRYPLANSYILNPIPYGNRMRTFRIPINRIMEFWGRADGKKEYEDNTSLSLRENGGNWRAFILTSDFQITSENFQISKSTGNKDADPYFEVKVSSGTKGNVIVAVGPADNSSPQNISWSWHLWITDYNPYDALNWNQSISGQYIYPVTNGVVHRYEGTFWGMNDKTYIMDRNLGAKTIEYPEDNIGLVYYQYGRKDPFFFSRSIYQYPENTGHTRKVVSYESANQENGIHFSIKNPLSFIKGAPYNVSSSESHTNWTAACKYAPAENNVNIIWHDHTTDKYGTREGCKSIFDPCPPGYRVADKNTWLDFQFHNREKPTTNAFESNKYISGTELVDSLYINNFKAYNKIKGLQYWPYMGKNILIPDNAIYIPASGHLSPGGDSGGENTSHGNQIFDNVIGSAYEKWSFLWADVSPSQHSGHGYTAQQDHLSQTNIVSKTRGLPVRCITDNKK